ncbi:hypothetical protein XENTR_v10005084 [Xenopus tropicalis]|nr:hypothetical protein XENTR_v10005084 [Xenopus tropicalis]
MNQKCTEFGKGDSGKGNLFLVNVSCSDPVLTVLPYTDCFSNIKISASSTLDCNLNRSLPAPTLDVYDHAHNHTHFESLGPCTCVSIKCNMTDDREDITVTAELSLLEINMASIFIRQSLSLSLYLVAKLMGDTQELIVTGEILYNSSLYQNLKHGDDKAQITVTLLKQIIYTLPVIAGSNIGGTLLFLILVILVKINVTLLEQIIYTLTVIIGSNIGGTLRLLILVILAKKRSAHNICWKRSWQSKIFSPSVGLAHQDTRKTPGVSGPSCS